jgi:hypothetical protein
MKMNVTCILRCAVFSFILIIASFVAEGQPGIAKSDNVFCSQPNLLVSAVSMQDACSVDATGYIIPSRFVIVK